MTEITSLCVYCGSRTGDDTAHAEAARRLGATIAGAGIRMIFGGGAIGLMGVAARAALGAGGEVIGVIPRHLDEVEIGMADASELIVVANMHERKRRMFDLADAFVVLPGGVGTLDEAFEIITWRQLGLHDKPIVLLDNRSYWRPLLALIASTVDAGFASESIKSLYTVVGEVDEVLPAIRAAAAPRVAPASDLL